MSAGRRSSARYSLFGLFLVLSILAFTGCIEVSVNPAEESIDVRATLDAMGHPNGEQAQAQPQPQVVPPTQTPAPTATVYVPEGQLVYENFSRIPVGREWAVHEGISARKLEEGIEYEIQSKTEYLIRSDMADIRDANVSTFALSNSNPKTSIALVACRTGWEEDESGVSKMKEGYFAKLRFDGQSQLVKKLDKNDILLFDWQPGAALNPEGVFNQLYLLCDGSRLLFMVNGQVVFDTQDSDLQIGAYAIGVGNLSDTEPAVVQIDKFAVFEP